MPQPLADVLDLQPVGLHKLAATEDRHPQPLLAAPLQLRRQATDWHVPGIPQLANQPSTANGSEVVVGLS